MEQKHHVLVTGGAGYVGSALVPKLLAAGHTVTVLDLYIYGESVFGSYHGHSNLVEIKGDIRDEAKVKQALKGCDVVLHLACISNDPSFELNPTLGKSINFDAFRPLVRAAKSAGAQRFIYASSSSVYGVKEEPDVTEDLPLEPLTDYSKFKALCEEVLLEEQTPDFAGLIIRPATVCGYAPRQRLDLTVNILTNHAVNNGKIKVFGGSQKRPNLHIEDMTDLYCFLLDVEQTHVKGRVFNVGYENHSVMELATIVRDVVGSHVDIETVATDDLRSYHISSKKIKEALGFSAKHTIKEAVKDLIAAFQAQKLPNSMEDPRYFNIKMMQNLNLV